MEGLKNQKRLCQSDSGKARDAVTFTTGNILENGPKHLDEDLTSLDWLHESKNLLRGFSAEGEGLCYSNPIQGFSVKGEGLRYSNPIQGFSAGGKGLCYSSPLQGVSMKGGELHCTGQTPPAKDYLPPKRLHLSGQPQCLVDGASKPPYSFTSLIFMAIEESPSRCLPVKDIYRWIVQTFPYYQEAGAGWKNSVRHNLSLSKCFRKVEKDEKKMEGKGSLWYVEPEHRPALQKALRKTCCSPLPSLVSSTAHPTTVIPDAEGESSESEGGLFWKDPLLGDAEHADVVIGSESASEFAFLTSDLSRDHNYSVFNLHMHPDTIPYRPEETVLLASPGGEDNKDVFMLEDLEPDAFEAEGGKDPLDDSGYGGSEEYLVFVEETDQCLDLHLEGVEVDREAKEAAGCLLNLAGIPY
nr:PREDICTED: forkhead box protein N2-like isoform X2 [Latimeria chalumnae]XP_005988858.1 PREDICTED: forkhead box protein N2-like isoform X2 [Latimeria chalumnae]|eukprot:XP_005988856.1 PREDICTED: forkhead box protein N2-like isoform X2 [Latimeria chalumnae]